MNLNKQLSELTLWQKQLFTAALLQRMLPNYRLFAESAGAGDYSLVANQLDIAWQKLSGLPIKFNPEVQLEKLAAQVPEQSEFDFFAILPAIDFCTGLECLLNSFIDKNSDCANEVSLLSKSGVMGYLTFLEEQNSGDDKEAQLEIDNNDPLLIWESEIQQALLKMVLEAKTNKDSCSAIKVFAVGERISNIGVEY